LIESESETLAWIAACFDLQRRSGFSKTRALPGFPPLSGADELAWLQTEGI
jgi:hypothetical protein